MTLLVVGSAALDTVETPFGRVSGALGGSAIYFSLAASLYSPGQVKLVGVVGEDFPREHLDFLTQRGVDLKGLEVVPGRTFRWEGRYDYNLNTAETLATELNVFADFHPRLPQEYTKAKYVFLANIDPELQLEVLHQVKAPELVMLDTMNYWIEHKRAALTRAIQAVDLVTVNEAELRQFTGTYGLFKAAGEILALGPRAVIVKRGEYGAALFCRDDCFTIPAYPLAEVKDPTGAGDTFAGGFLGYLARVGECTPETLRCAVVHGCIIASFTVEDFSVNRLRRLTWQQIEERFQEFRRFTHFE